MCVTGCGFGWKSPLSPTHFTLENDDQPSQPPQCLSIPLSFIATYPTHPSTPPLLLDVFIPSAWQFEFSPLSLCDVQRPRFWRFTGWNYKQVGDVNGGMRLEALIVVIVCSCPGMESGRGRGRDRTWWEGHVWGRPHEERGALARSLTALRFPSSVYACIAWASNTLAPALGNERETLRNRDLKYTHRVTYFSIFFYFFAIL